MATVVDIAGAEYPASYRGNPVTPLQGVSLRPAFEEDVDSDRYLFWEHENNRAIRQGKWKLVCKASRRTDLDADLPTPYDLRELYDLDADRTETRNLAAERPEKVRQLADEWERIAWQSAVNPYPEAYNF